jgi:hypothetical protein
VKVSAVLHNLLVGHHIVPKSWLSLEDLIDPDVVDDLDETFYLSSFSSGSGISSHGNLCEEVQTF